MALRPVGDLGRPEDRRRDGIEDGGGERARQRREGRLPLSDAKRATTSSGACPRFVRRALENEHPVLLEEDEPLAGHDREEREDRRIVRHLEAVPGLSSAAFRSPRRWRTSARSITIRVARGTRSGLSATARGVGEPEGRFADEPGKRRDEGLANVALAWKDRSFCHGVLVGARDPFRGAARGKAATSTSTGSAPTGGRFAASGRRIGTDVPDALRPPRPPNRVTSARSWSSEAHQKTGWRDLASGALPRDRRPRAP